MNNFVKLKYEIKSFTTTEYFSSEPRTFYNNPQ
jgi:hypothetical protein